MIFFFNGVTLHRPSWNAVFSGYICVRARVERGRIEKNKTGRARNGVKQRKMKGKTASACSRFVRDVFYGSSGCRRSGGGPLVNCMGVEVGGRRVYLSLENCAGRISTAHFYGNNIC